MSAHTPGPWHVRTFDESIGSIDAAGDMTVAQAMQIRPIHAEPHQDERRANARLIAAAPELLEACIAVNRCGNGGARLDRSASDKVRAAIKKATEAA